MGQPAQKMGWLAPYYLYPSRLGFLDFEWFDLAPTGVGSACRCSYCAQLSGAIQLRCQLRQTLQESPPSIAVLTCADTIYLVSRGWCAKMDQSQENTSTAVSRIAFSWLIHSYVSSILRPRVKSGSHLMLVPGAAWDCNSCTVWPSWKSMKSPKSNVYPCPPPESNFLDIAWCLDISPTFWFRGISCLITATGASHACDSVTEFSSSILSLTPKQVRGAEIKQ